MILPSNTYSPFHTIIVKREEKKNVPFNTKIDYSDICEVVIVTDNMPRRLRNLDEKILNPKKMNIFCRKIDPRTHVIYYIKRAPFDGSWGGNIQYEDKKANQIQEKIYIRISYSFVVDRGDRFIQLLSETQNEYNQRYVVRKINPKIDNMIKAIISQNLNQNGYVKAQETILACANEIQTKLNEEILSRYGIKILNLNLCLEEDEQRSTKQSENERNELDKGELQENV